MNRTIPANLRGYVQIGLDRGILNGSAVAAQGLDRGPFHALIESMRSSGAKMFAVMASANCPSCGPSTRSSTTGGT